MWRLLLYRRRCRFGFRLGLRFGSLHRLSGDGRGFRYRFGFRFGTKHAHLEDQARFLRYRERGSVGVKQERADESGMYCQ